MTAEEQLDELYAELPELDCRGQCWDSCSKIDMTGAERWRIEKAGGPHIPRGRVGDPPSMCPALTMLHQCSVYEIRPMVCRLWGVWESLPCNYGCRPKDGRALLTDEEAYEFIARTHEAAGEPGMAAMVRRPWRENPELARREMVRFRRVQADEDLARQVRRKRIIESGAPVIFVRGRGQISSKPPASGANS